jgi:micrococcal nuclease
MTTGARFAARVNCWLAQGLDYGQSAAMCRSFRTIFAVLGFTVAATASAGERCSAIDGNTLQCGRERVLVEGLRSPRIHEPGGEEARARLQRRIRWGELVIERKGRDKWGRTLGRAYLNGNRITQLDLAPQSGRVNRRR